MSRSPPSPPGAAIGALALLIGMALLSEPLDIHGWWGVGDEALPSWMSVGFGIIVAPNHIRDSSTRDLRLLDVEDEGHGAVVHQADLHLGPEHPARDLDARSGELLGQRVNDGPGKVGIGGGGE